MSAGCTITNNGKKNLQKTMKRDHEEFYSIIINQHVIFEALNDRFPSEHNRAIIVDSLNRLNPGWLLITWDELQQETIRKSIPSFRKCLHTCISTKGGHFEHTL